MTYIADLDPENPARRQQEIAEAFWDDQCPEWREQSIDPEDRQTVPENDVLNPDETIIRGFGGDHRYVVSFGRND